MVSALDLSYFGLSATSSAGYSGRSALAVYKEAETRGASAVSKTGEQPAVQREIKHVMKRLGEINSFDELIKDRRTMDFILKGFGMETEAQYMGRLKKVLIEDPANENALVNKLTDTRFKELASALGLKGGDITKLKDASFQADLQDRFIKASYESQLAQQSPAAVKARTFAKVASQIDGNAYTVLGDPRMREVVLETLGIPKQVAIQSVETQARTLQSKVDLSKFEDPAYVEKFIQRYLTQADMQNTSYSLGSSSTNIKSYVVSLFA